MVFESGTSYVFVNRAAELRWINERAHDRSNWRRALQVVGQPGIGKTALVQHFLNTQNTSRSDALTFRHGPEFDLDRLDYWLRDNRAITPSTIIIDESGLRERDVEGTLRAVFNWKAVRNLFITDRQAVRAPHIDTLTVGPLDERASRELFRLLAPGKEVPDALLSLTEGHPLAITLVAHLLATEDPNRLAALLQGNIYSLENQLLIPGPHLIGSVQPKLVLANEQILERLKARPEDIHQIGHRKFEELIAELLDDMGFDVELTKATRDGGRDVLAYWDSPVGRLLCIVEAKKYRPDRPVGIEIVRTLYGTLMDEEANSAILVTTADFSPDARQFAARHKLRLGLKNYTDLVKWIGSYKVPKKKGNIILPD